MPAQWNKLNACYYFKQVADACIQMGSSEAAPMIMNLKQGAQSVGWKGAPRTAIRHAKHIFPRVVISVDPLLDKFARETA
jgi:hypothetical protein